MAAVLLAGAAQAQATATVALPAPETGAPVSPPPMPPETADAPAAPQTPAADERGPRETAAPADVPPPPPQTVVYTEVPPPPRLPPRVPHYVFRVSGGFALISQDIFCNLYPSTICPTSGTPLGISPVVDAEFELWWSRSFYSEEGTAKDRISIEHAVSFGASVLWSHYSPPQQVPNLPPPTVNAMLWEPHFDVRWGVPGPVRWRFFLGLGLYIASATAGTPYGQTDTSGVGVAFRVGAGATFLPHEPVSLAVDVLLEGGWVGGVTVWSGTLLIGPEVHFD
ncbi:MAG TPA: hypothetical protein VEJ89_11225 [Myxococcaceae bacterium]|jgi:hypothetical protein|nr:hypothetical protein [Myxococcaceae bacterium]